MTTTRVHELAKSLGVPSTDIVAWLTANGHFVKSASSAIKPILAERIRAAFNGGISGESTRPAGRYGMSPDLGLVDDADVDAGSDPRREAARLFGVSERSLRLRDEALPRRGGPRHRRTVDRRAAAHALIPFDMSEMELVFYRRLPGIERSELDSLVSRWDSYNFTPGEVAAWLDAGARPHDYWAAMRLRDARVPARVALMQASQGGQKTKHTFLGFVADGTMPAAVVYRLAVRAGKIGPESSAS